MFSLWFRGRFSVIGVVFLYGTVGTSVRRATKARTEPPFPIQPLIITFLFSFIFKLFSKIGE